MNLQTIVNATTGNFAGAVIISDYANVPDGVWKTTRGVKVGFCGLTFNEEGFRTIQRDLPTVIKEADAFFGARDFKKDVELLKAGRYDELAVQPLEEMNKPTKPEFSQAAFYRHVTKNDDNVFVSPCDGCVFYLHNPESKTPWLCLQITEEVHQRRRKMFGCDASDLDFILSLIE